MADRTHSVDGTNGPVGFSNYARSEFINTLEYLILKVGVAARLKEIADGESYHVLAPTRDSDHIVSSATVLWPDGSAGVWTGTNKNATFLYYDGWTLTHVDSGKTVTQAAVTRNGDGEVTSYPTLTVT